MAKKNTKSKSTKAAEVEEIDDEDVELEDLDEDVEESDAPAKKSKTQEVEFGASDLAEYLSNETGKTISTRDLRALIRKMAREDNPRIQREITPGNRTRYNWPGGLDNPEVQAIVEAVTGGEMEADKKAKLEELKKRKAEKTAAKGSTKKSKKSKKAAKVEEPEDDDVEEIEIDDEDE